MQKNKRFTGYVIDEKKSESLRKEIERKKPTKPASQIYTAKSQKTESVSSWLEDSIFETARRAKMLSCVDLVVGAWCKKKEHEKNGKELRIASFLRGPNESYPNTYCMYGGNIGTFFTSPEAFLLKQVSKESGVDLPKKTPLYYLGTYITRCPWTAIGTMNVCYCTIVNQKLLENLKPDPKTQIEAKVFTEKEWHAIKDQKKFWYQDRTFTLIWKALK